MICSDICIYTYNICCAFKDVFVCTENPQAPPELHVQAIGHFCVDAVDPCGLDGGGGRGISTVLRDTLSRRVLH